jgi:hypothetical protein
MAPNHEQKAKSGGMSSAKTPEKEELARARAVERAERVEARRVQAEERKEAVRPHYLSCQPIQNDELLPNDKESHHHVLGKCSIPCG